MRLLILPGVALLGLLVSAVPQGEQSSSTTSASTSTIPTATASASAASSLLPSQAPVPPRQQWCISAIHCPGPLLQTVNLAHLFEDSKTFVDKPTNGSTAQVLEAFAALGVENNTATLGGIADFVSKNFRGEGLELVPQSLNLPANPPLLSDDSLPNPLVRGFTSAVNLIWTSLIRTTNSSAYQCSQGNSSVCESTLIPLNHTFVVPGGRFREQYYWDSYWIVLGLLQSQLYDEVNSTLQNFMDELNTIGFIPNGGRTYYLDRSQPPFFIKGSMVYEYVDATNDTGILTRAIPLAEKEMAWWKRERSLNVSGHEVYRYRVVNSAPRPEAYLEDYLVTNGDDLPPNHYNNSQREALWAELATCAESGYDFSTRWLKVITSNETNNTVALRSLNARSIVPVELNSILYDAHMKLADLYGRSNFNNRSSAASTHRSIASDLREAVLDIFWDPNKLAFYDYNLTSSSLNGVFSAANFYPLWLGITPQVLLRNTTAAQLHFSSVGVLLARYNGTYPVTFIESGLQWDAPSAWPMHQQITLGALLSLPRNVSDGDLIMPEDAQNWFTLVPDGQMGMTEDKLPPQPKEEGGDFERGGGAADVNLLKGDNGEFRGWMNGGNGTLVQPNGTVVRLGWRDAYVSGLANRYTASTFCSWHASGGSIPDLVPPLPDDQRLPGSEGLGGLMFEKYSNIDVDSAGRGGEYVVQAGFGWSNGVQLWISGNLGIYLQDPTCPTSPNRAGGGGSSGSGSGGSNGGDQSGGAMQMVVSSWMWSLCSIILLGLLL